VTRAEAAWVSCLMESILDGQRGCREVSDELQINLELIQLVANRMREQRRGVPASPPDSMLDYCVPLVYRVMLRPWQ
jgi:hypothetical protein